jgi:uncharacterized protein (TIGR02147 family)
MKKSIYEYSDYREYMKDYYSAMKERNQSLSYRALAQKANMSSPSLFKMVMDGERNLSKATLVKAYLAFDLEGPEAEYFENLVFFNQAKTVDEKNYFFDKLVLVQKKSKNQVISLDRYDFFSEWYHPVVREYVTQSHFQGDLTKMSLEIDPKITEKEIKDSIQLLLKLGFIVKSGKTYKQSEPSITSGPSIKNIRIIQFQIKMLQIVRRSFDSTPAELRLNSTTIFGISQKTYEQFVVKSRQFRAQLQELAEADIDANKVYLLQMSMIPLTKN